VQERDNKRLQYAIDSLTRQIEEQEALVREYRACSHGMLLLEALDNLGRLKRQMDDLRRGTVHA
jgi:hypothetical protein